jgi:hypothetical protein
MNISLRHEGWSAKVVGWPDNRVGAGSDVPEFYHQLRWIYCNATFTWSLRGWVYSWYLWTKLSVEL